VDASLSDYVTYSISKYVIVFPNSCTKPNNLFLLQNSRGDSAICVIRPLTLKRYPEEINGSILRKERAITYPILDEEVRRPSQRRRLGIHYVLYNDRAMLVWATNLADIEKHALLAGAPDLNRPTLLVFDLDPGERREFWIAVAMMARVKAPAAPVFSSARDPPTSCHRRWQRFASRPTCRCPSLCTPQ
jgi:hypothetical protein